MSLFEFILGSEGTCGGQGLCTQGTVSLHYLVNYQFKYYVRILCFSFLGCDTCHFPGYDGYHFLSSFYWLNAISTLQTNLLPTCIKKMYLKSKFIVDCQLNLCSGILQHWKRCHKIWWISTSYL